MVLDNITNDSPSKDNIKSPYQGKVRKIPFKDRLDEPGEGTENSEADSLEYVPSGSKEYKKS